MTARIVPVSSIPPKEQYENEQRARLSAAYEDARNRVAEHFRKNPFGAISGIGEMSLVPGDSYEQAVEKFLPQWGRYLNEDRTYRLGRSATIVIHPVISNIGPVVAATVTLLIEIPEGLRLASESEIEAYEDHQGAFRPNPPKDPKAIEHRLDFYGLSTLNSDPIPFVSVAPDPTDSRGPHYTSKGHSQYVRYDVPSITPRRSEENLPPFLVVADCVSVERTFQFSTQLFAESLETPMENKLSLRISIGSEKDETL